MCPLVHIVINGTEDGSRKGTLGKWFATQNFGQILPFSLILA